jgi:hypothetical protein
MSVRMVLDPASIDETVSYVEQTRERILDAIRTSMLEAMHDLAWNVADKLQGDPIVSRSGELLGAILASPSVTVKSESITGSVWSDVGEKHIGLWLEEGTHVPAVDGKLFQFTEPDGKTFFTRGHRAFDVKPHPFLNPALHESETMIFELIQQAVDGAIVDLGGVPGTEAIAA